MTTIAFDGKTMAADGRITYGDIICTDDDSKIYRLEDNRWSHKPVIVGIEGEASGRAEILKWCETDAKDKPEGEWSALIYDGSTIFVVDVKNESPELWESGVAIGSGYLAAMAAMRAGADARRAVEVAITMDVYSGGKITTMELTG